MQFLLPFHDEVPGHGFYREFHRGVTAALREMGHEAVPFPFAKQHERTPDEVQSLYRLLAPGRVAAVLDLCCWGHGLSHFLLHKRTGEKVPIYDAFEVPYVAMLFDHPFNQTVDRIVARRLYATYPDLGHPEQLRAIYPELRLSGAMFVPPAIRVGSDCPAAGGADRDVDVLYVGNLAVHALERFWRDPANENWRPVYDAAVCDAIADAALAAPELSYHLSVQAAMARLGAQSPGFELLSQMRGVEWFLRARFRRDAVLALAGSGLRMLVVGRGWESVDLPASVEHRTEIEYESLLRLPGRARICLDCSTYLDGANDRVFTYALNGAACFTNAAGYLRGQFGGDGGVRFYSMLQLDALAESMRELLARPAALRAAAEHARARVLAAHTWRNRLSEILAALGM
jgi:hypothetical protein